MASQKAGSRLISQTASEVELKHFPIPRTVIPLIHEIRTQGLSFMDFQTAPKFWVPTWNVPALEGCGYNTDGEPARELLFRQIQGGLRMSVDKMFRMYHRAIVTERPALELYKETGRFLVRPEVGLFFAPRVETGGHHRFACEAALFVQTVGGGDLIQHKDSYFSVFGERLIGVVEGSPVGRLQKCSRQELHDIVTAQTTVPSSSILPVFKKLAWLTKTLSPFWQDYMALLGLMYRLGRSSVIPKLDARLEAGIETRLAKVKLKTIRYDASTMVKSALREAKKIAEWPPSATKADAFYLSMVPVACSKAAFHKDYIPVAKLRSQRIFPEEWQIIARTLEAKIGDLDE